MTLSTKQKLLLVDIAFILSFLLAQTLILRDILGVYFSIPLPRIIISLMLLLIWLVGYNAISLHVFLNPFKKLRPFLKKIGEGKLDTPIPKIDGEVGEVAREISSMKKSLKKNIESVSKAQALEKKQSEFILISSHQLRTPITSLKWGVETLLKNSKNITPKDKEILKMMKAAAKDSSMVIDQLLTTAETEISNKTDKKQSTDIIISINKVIEQYKYIAERKQITIKLNTIGKTPSLQVNPLRLKSVVQCLIENAVDYAQNNTSIKIKVKVKSDKLIFSVTNQGIGIQPKDQSRIFSKLFRSQNALKTKTAGSGLCLFLSKNIIESFAGKIWFKSKPNKSTTFYFSIPLSSEARVDKFLKSF